MPPIVFSRADIVGRAIIDTRTAHFHDVAEAYVREEYPEAQARPA